MSFEAAHCENGHLNYPPHPRCPTCGALSDGRVNLGEYEGVVITWTTSTATPTGVRSPNPLAIVEFEVDGDVVRAIGQATTDDIAIGDRVRPVYAEELRDPGAGIREAESQDWDGYRFEPVD